MTAQDDAKKVATSGGSLPESLAQVYETYFDFVWRNARRLGVPEASADDVAQDVFLIVQRRISDCDGRSSMQAWIFGILVRVVRDHRRSCSMKRRHKRAPLLPDIFECVRRVAQAFTIRPLTCKIPGRRGQSPVCTLLANIASGSRSRWF
jgi:RNA polymerase sigma-70 factor (ECF subfamily)